MDGQLLNEFNEKEFKNINKKKTKRIIIILVILFLILIIGLIFVAIKYFYFENENHDSENEIEDEDPYKLDIISEEELNLARNSFRQDNFSDSKDPTKYLQYNIFIPENYTENKRYPLIIFLGDETTIGKETNISLFKSVGGPIWATKLIQKKHKCFILVPQYNEKIIDENCGNLKNESINITMNLVSSIISK